MNHDLFGYTNNQHVLGVGHVGHNSGLSTLLQTSNNDILDFGCNATTQDLLQLEEITDELLMTSTQFPENILSGEVKTGGYATVGGGVIGMENFQSFAGLGEQQQKLQEAVFDNSPNATDVDQFLQPINSDNSPPRVVQGQNASGSQCKQQESSQKESDKSEENDDRHQRYRRTPKQQQQNKQAQQRYRLRKKQRFQDMEGTIELLNQRVQQLQNMETLNQQLLLQQVEADRLLKTKDDEIKWLRNQITTNNQFRPQNVRIINSSYNNNQFDVQQQQQQQQFQQINQNIEQQQQQQQQQCLFVQNQCENVYDNNYINHFNESLKESFYRSVMQIRNFLEESNVLQLHETGKMIPEPKISECQYLIKQACENCSKLLSENASHTVEIIHHYVNSNQPQKCLFTTIQKLRISLEQKKILQQVGKSQSARLKQLYAERYKINQEIVTEINNSNQLSLIQNRGSSSSSSNLAKDQEIYADAVIESIEQKGYFQNCGYQLRLLKLARDLKSNVRNEYKFMHQLTKFVVGQVLTPIQASIYVVSLFPQHCDAFPLTNQLQRTN